MHTNSRSIRDLLIMFVCSSMAFKALAQRLFGVSRIAAAGDARRSPRAALTLNRNPMKLGKVAPDNGDDGISRRYLHRQSGSTSDGLRRLLPTGENRMEKLREMDGCRERIRLDGLPSLQSEKPPEAKVMLKDAKILKLAQLERARSRLKLIEKDSVSYSEYLEICAKDCSSFENGVELAKMLDQSGSVIVLGNTVLLRPEEVVKAIEGLIPIPNQNIPDDSTIEELQQLEKQKVAIDRKAMSLVQLELVFGLATLVVQTAAFMRLTFWEISWDVMEPICFFVASFYVIGVYTFFLRTAKEPTFGGFFQIRFRTKQKRLMRLQAFDINRYNELKKACYPKSLADQ